MNSDVEHIYLTHDSDFWVGLVKGQECKLIGLLPSICGRRRPKSEFDDV